MCVYVDENGSSTAILKGRQMSMRVCWEGGGIDSAPNVLRIINVLFRERMREDGGGTRGRRRYDHSRGWEAMHEWTVK